MVEEIDMGMMTAAQAAEQAKGLTFETVWAAMMETDKKFQETERIIKENAAEMKAMSQEADKRQKEAIARMEAMSQEADKRKKETDKKFQEAAEAQKKTDEMLDKLGKNVGGNNRSMGELVETLVAARLWEKFAAYPYHLERAYQRLPIYDERNQLKSDIDILLVDTQWCMAVEVKREADEKDVAKHLKRMDLIRKYPPAEVVGKRMLGAIAGGIVTPEAKEFAHECGFFVLELTGESVELLDAPEGFTAREW
jgi:hypothetical protein